jgi:hypothetical protein
MRGTHAKPPKVLIEAPRARASNRWHLLAAMARHGMLARRRAALRRPATHPHAEEIT